MNANQNKNLSQPDPKRSLALIPLEKAESPSLWQRMKISFATPDLNFQEWQRLESKRTRPDSSKHWGNN